VQWPDLIWPVFLLLDIEHVRIEPGITRFTPFDFYDYPWSHSLLMAVVWSGVIAGIYFLIRRSRRGATVIAAAVFSHWVLDFVTHRPDLQLWPGSSTRVGLGLWNNVPITIAVEATMFVVAIGIYRSATRPRDAQGRWGLWTLIAGLVALYVNVVIGPPPPDVKTLATLAPLAWLFVPWAYWVDHHRMPAESWNP
jgi:membrane-bound metal-dependent hydrolase YbcI (DUF457 family)